VDELAPARMHVEKGPSRNSPEVSHGAAAVREGGAQACVVLVLPLGKGDKSARRTGDAGMRRPTQTETASIRNAEKHRGQNQEAGIGKVHEAELRFMSRRQRCCYVAAARSHVLPGVSGSVCEASP